MGAWEESGKWFVYHILEHLDLGGTSLKLKREKLAADKVKAYDERRAKRVRLCEEKSVVWRTPLDKVAEIYQPTFFNRTRVLSLSNLVNYKI